MATIYNVKPRTDDQLTTLLNNYRTAIIEKLSVPEKVKNVNARLSKIEKYCTVMDSYMGGNFPKFTEYYSDFYQMNNMNTDYPFRSVYFGIMSGYKPGNANDLYWHTCGALPVRIRGVEKFELSFVSKLVHTVFPNEPIYDRKISFVLWNLKQPFDLGNAKITNGQIVLKEISKMYSQMNGAPLGNLVLDIFNEALAAILDGYALKIDSSDPQKIALEIKNSYPDFDYSKITFEKKCDFVFMALGEILLKQKNAEKPLKRI